MAKTTYEEYKYSLQDVSRIYLGCKYSFMELITNEDLSFKFRMIIEKYILQEVLAEAQMSREAYLNGTTLEQHLYYLPADGFIVQIYKQMKARIKVNVIEEKKALFGRIKKQYVTKTFTIEDLVRMTTDEKKAVGLVIQELSVSKLALMSL